jgi:hypothetical protein
MDLIRLGSYAAALVLYMSFGKLIMVTMRYGLPIMHYISFSDIYVYISHVLYNLTKVIGLGLLLFIFKTQLYCYMQTAISHTGKMTFFFPLLGVASIIAIIMAIRHWCLKKYNPNITKWLLFVCVGLLGIVAKYWIGANGDVLLFFMMFGFCYIYLKDVVEDECKQLEMNADYSSSIIFKDPAKQNFKSNDKCYIFIHTSNFVFIFNSEDKSCTTIPMSEVFALNINGLAVPSKEKKAQGLENFGWINRDETF